MRKPSLICLHKSMVKERIRQFGTVEVSTKLDRQPPAPFAFFHCTWNSEARCVQVGRVRKTLGVLWRSTLP